MPVFSKLVVIAATAAIDIAMAAPVSEALPACPAYQTERHCTIEECINKALAAEGMCCYDHTHHVCTPHGATACKGADLALCQASHKPKNAGQIIVKKFSVRNNCDEDIEVEDFGKVPKHEQATFFSAGAVPLPEARKAPSDAAHLKWRRASWDIEGNNGRWEMPFAMNGAFMVATNGDLNTPLPLTNLPDVEPWYGYGMSSSLVAFSPGTSEPACVDAGAAWSAKDDMSDCAADAGGLVCDASNLSPECSKRKPVLQCSIPDYRICPEHEHLPFCHTKTAGDLDPRCTDCPGSVGDCQGKYSQFSKDHTWAWNGDSQSWSKTKFECPEGHPAAVCGELPGYWTTPEQQCWKDQPPVPGHSKANLAVGFWGECKTVGKEVDIVLDVCGIGQDGQPAVPKNVIS